MFAPSPPSCVPDVTRSWRHGWPLSTPTTNPPCGPLCFVCAAPGGVRRVDHGGDGLEHMFDMVYAAAMRKSWHVGGEARPDGPVHYRVDGTGWRVGILPATCKRGLHSLHQAGYRAAEKDGELRVTCQACAAEPHPDHSWRLSTTEPRPEAAELDELPTPGSIRCSSVGQSSADRARRSCGYPGRHPHRRGVEPRSTGPGASAKGVLWTSMTRTSVVVFVRSVRGAECRRTTWPASSLAGNSPW